jgi:nucleoside-diphosphate-sugar epimerase
MDSSRLNKLGWKAKTDLELGLTKTYEDFKKFHQVSN